MIKTLPIDKPTRAALQQAAQALSDALQQAQPHAICQALRDSARAHASVLALGTAEGELQQALRWSQATASTDLSVDLLCDLCDLTELWAGAEDQLRDGAGETIRERTRGYAFEAAVLSGTVSDPGWEVQVLLRLGRVLVRCGDSDDAEALRTRARRLMEGLPNETADPHQMPELGRLADA